MRRADPCRSRPKGWGHQKERNVSISEELEKLGELHQRGVLTDDEFARAKSRLIGEPGGSASSSSSSLPPQSKLPFVAGFNALRRSASDRWIGGVCGGIAPVLGLESWVCRLLIAVLTLFGGFGVIVYLLLWIFVPQE
jgi:phage shock protein C